MNSKNSPRRKADKIRPVVRMPLAEEIVMALFHAGIISATAPMQRSFNIAGSKISPLREKIVSANTVRSTYGVQCFREALTMIDGDDPNASAQVCERDPSYANAWQCNIAAPLMDHAGLSHDKANQVADILMRHLFDVKPNNADEVLPSPRGITSGGGLGDLSKGK